MNYIAHLFLSGTDEGLIVGNFIGDSIKGKDYLNYPAHIQQGILLHRHIDCFTDTHPIIHKSKAYLVPIYNHWAGVLIDIFYGYILTLNFKNYSSESLSDFAKRVQNILIDNYHFLNEDTKMFLDYSIKYNRIEHFDKIQTIDEVLKGIAGRTKYVSNIENATADLLYHLENLVSDFNAFFPQLISETQTYISNHKT